MKSQTNVLAIINGFLLICIISFGIMFISGIEIENGPKNVIEETPETFSDDKEPEPVILTTPASRTGPLNTQENLNIIQSDYPFYIDTSDHDLDTLTLRPNNLDSVYANIPQHSSSNSLNEDSKSPTDYIKISSKDSLQSNDSFEYL